MYVILYYFHGGDRHIIRCDEVVLLFWILAEGVCLLFCLLQTQLLADQHFSEALAHLGL